MRRTRLIGLAAALLCVAPVARGALLYERPLVFNRNINIFTTDVFGLKLVFGDSVFTPSNPVTLFDGVTITPADEGHTFVANSAADPAFAEAVVRMTDGLNQFVRMAFTEVASGRPEQQGWQERGFFIGPATEDHPDLAGLDIREVRLRIDNFSLSQNSSTANPLAATGPEVQLEMTFEVFGVPEPSALETTGGGLLGLAVAAYTVARRRRAIERALCRGLCPAARGAGSAANCKSPRRSLASQSGARRPWHGSSSG